MLTRRTFVASLAAARAVAARSEPALTQVEVFRAGEDGYHSYRIPSLILTPRRTLLAFCEGRRNSSSDTGDIDLVMKRSADGGATWSAQRVLFDRGADTVGNPCPVVDRRTGAIWLLLTSNPGSVSEKQIRASEPGAVRTVWVTHSKDDGETWAPLADITAAVKQRDWTWYATGPGVGIQLRGGRLIVPCDHNRAGSGARYSHVIYSDDSGATWKIGGIAQEHTNECQVVELSDGSLLLNMRSYEGKNRRALARSRDGGLTWSDPALDDALVEPVCQASLASYGRGRLLFSNPADTTRVRLTVRVSYDEGATWPACRVLHGGPGAYSCLAVLPDSTIGCLYERGEKGPNERITFARFPFEWLAGRRKPDLVELTRLDASIRLDIRYATANNLAGRAVYAEPRAFLQRPAALALVRAHRALRKHGYGLLIFDGYRPWSVTKTFWDVTPHGKRQFVANPAAGSKHNRGCAVDLSMFHLDSGREVEMPSVYDEMSERAYPKYTGGTLAQRSARDLLRREMERQRFTVEPNEWWHFNYKDWPLYPIGDLPFSRVAT
jgi:sialidase-1